MYFHLMYSVVSYTCVAFCSHQYFVSLLTVLTMDYCYVSGARRVVLNVDLAKYFPLLLISVCCFSTFCIIFPYGG